MIEIRQSLKISVPEEIAYRTGCIDKNDLLKAAGQYRNLGYGHHLRNAAKDKVIFS